MIFNKKGQVLVLFVFLLPILIMICAFVVDIGIITNSKNNLENVIRLAIKEEIENIDNKSSDRIKDLLKQNKIDITNLKITISDNKINIKNEIKVASIFGKIIGIDNYKVKVNLNGYIKDNKVLIE